MRELRILSPTAILGYGFPAASFEAGMVKAPHVIAVDAGSTDPGPYYLGAGVSFTYRAAVKRDLEIMLTAGVHRNIPIIIGTGGGCGADPHLMECADIVREIAREKNLHFKLAVIHAELDKEWVKEQLVQNRVHPLGPAPALTQTDIAESTHIVAQMGLEPIIEALKKGAQVIVAGRAYDPTVFAAVPILEGYDPGLALHMGKILECASIAAVPGSGSDCMLGYLRDDHFLLEPLNPSRKCTTTSVAAHTLYEKTNPYMLPGPGGTIDLHQTKFEQLDDRTVRVSGSRYIPAIEYMFKLEGAKKVGYRTVSMAGARDPVFISKIDMIIAGVRERVQDNFIDVPSDCYHLFFHTYGRNAVMGDLDPEKKALPHELGIVIEVIASTQDLANTICSFARSTMLHYGYPGRISTAGNLAFPYSPSDFEAGEVYQFSVYHLVKVPDPLSLFPMDMEEV